MTNIYGLDVEYFYQALSRIIKNIESYTPEEMERSLLRLADVAKCERDVVKVTILKGRDEAGCYDYKLKSEIL